MRPHTNNSLSYKTIHPQIRKVLDERSRLDNTVQVSMPFVKATTTLQLPNIMGDGVGFTLGPHIDHDRPYENIYGTKNGKYFVGYTYLPNGTNEPIYADSPSGDLQNIVNILDLGTGLAGARSDFTFVPPPGITRVNIGKRRSGLISVANISFSVPTLWQLEFLHRTFLVPGVGMILEWGQQFAPKSVSSFGETGLTGNINDYMFPWYGPNAQGDTKEDLFRRLARNEVGVQEILEKYSYPTQGQYQWMFGRVGNFTVNSNPDGSYECMVRISGPSEDSWAYSVRNTTVPRTSREGDVIVCIDNTNSVESYFTKKSGIDSFIGVLEATLNGETPILDDWQPFVRRFNRPEDNNAPTTSQEGGEDLENSYFISWRYFVNIILNDETYGIKSIFKSANELPEWLNKISLLRKYNNINGEETATSNFIDPYENFVGNHKYLRSTDLSTMVIVNSEAKNWARNDPQREIKSGGDFELFEKYDTTELLNGVGGPLTRAGDFYFSARDVTNPQGASTNDLDRGFLSTGIWINHKAIIESFSTANTILDGLQNLLSRMSSATNGYWNLVVDISEPVYEQLNEEEGFGEIPRNAINIYNYAVVDLNYTENSEYAVNAFLNAEGENRVHIFNKYIRRLSDGTEIGSELTDCKVELSMPQTMFSQIATLGLVQADDKAAGGDINELSDRLPAIVSNINDDLRQMFSITSIARNPDGSSADLTALETISPDTETCSGDGPARVIPGILAGGLAGVSVENLTTAESVSAEIQNTNENIDLFTIFIERCRENCGEITRDVSESELSLYASSDPWSARFISYIGTRADPNFPKNALHINYAQSIRTNPPQGWQALDPRVETPRVGDIVIYNREGNRLRFDTPSWQGSSHGDIVVSIDTNRLSVIGGNLRGSVIPGGTVTEISVNLTEGKLPNEYFAILRPPAIVSLNMLGVAREQSRLWQDAPVAQRVALLQTYQRNIDPNGIPSLSEDPILTGFSSTETCSGSRQLRSVPWIDNPDEFDPDEASVNVRNCDAALRVLRLSLSKSNALNVRRAEIDRVQRILAIRREFPHLGPIYAYVEPFPDYMVANIRGSSNGDSSNAFGAAPGALTIKAELELPGLNGFRLGELFWIDRIPAFYKAFGAFIILGLEEEITQNGWVTKIGSSFYYLGNAWKGSMLKILRGQ